MHIFVLSCKIGFSTRISINRVNPLYIDTRYSEKVRLDDNLTDTKPQKVIDNQKLLIHQEHMFWIFVRIASVRRFEQVSKLYVL